MIFTKTLFFSGFFSSKVIYLKQIFVSPIKKINSVDKNFTL